MADEIPNAPAQPVEAAPVAESAPAQPVEAKKELTPREKLHNATQAYWKAIKSGDKKLAAKIHAENNLPYHAAHHS